MYLVVVRFLHTDLFRNIISFSKLLSLTAIYQIPVELLYVQNIHHKMAAELYL